MPPLGSAVWKLLLAVPANGFSELLAQWWWWMFLRRRTKACNMLFFFTPPPLMMLVTVGDASSMMSYPWWLWTLLPAKLNSQTLYTRLLVRINHFERVSETAWKWLILEAFVSLELTTMKVQIMKTLSYDSRFLVVVLWENIHVVVSCLHQTEQIGVSFWQAVSTHFFHVFWWSFYKAHFREMR